MGRDKYRARLTARSEYTVYRKTNRVPKSRIIKGRDNYTDFAKEFINTIFEELLERQGGVYLDKIGYMFNYMIPEKRAMQRTGKKPDYYFHSDLYHYFPVFLGNSKYNHWTMDRAFSNNYLKKFIEKLKSGKIYKNYLSTLKRLRKI